jgi:succinoglycan biosynthesis transport protein ExoP
MQALHGAVRGVGPISAIVGQQPLVAVPFIPVAAELVRRRQLLLKAAAIAAAAVVLLLLLVHFMLIPLDVLVMKALFRLS